MNSALLQWQHNGLFRSLNLYEGTFFSHLFSGLPCQRTAIKWLVRVRINKTGTTTTVIHVKIPSWFSSLSIRKVLGAVKRQMLELGVYALLDACSADLTWWCILYHKTLLGVFHRSAHGLSHHFTCIMDTGAWLLAYMWLDAWPHVVNPKSLAMCVLS